MDDPSKNGAKTPNASRWRGLGGAAGQTPPHACPGHTPCCKHQPLPPCGQQRTPRQRTPPRTPRTVRIQCQRSLPRQDPLPYLHLRCSSRDGRLPSPTLGPCSCRVRPPASPDPRAPDPGSPVCQPHPCPLRSPHESRVPRGEGGCFIRKVGRSGPDSRMPGWVKVHSVLSMGVRAGWYFLHFAGPPMSHCHAGESRSVLKKIEKKWICFMNVL